MKMLHVMLAATALTGLSATAASAAEQRPNVIVILVDDMGFSDIGAFGGEIRTPNLDALANKGLKFNNFHTTPVCAPTRAELLTGVDHHQTGIGNFPELRQDNQIDKPGYEGYLNDRVVTLAERLRDAGYATFQSGKWHLGYDPKANPVARGFEHSFTLLGGGHNHFGTDQGRERPDLPNVGLVYTLDGKQVPIPPKFYSSDYFTDKFLAFLPPAKDKRPFFGYLALTAPHYPIQAPAEDIKRYAGKYDAGYDVLRQERLARLKALKLVPDTVEPHAQTSAKRWADLTDDEKRIEARTMEAYAAMVDRIDQNVGRLVAELKKRGQYDNTVILFFSDNGPEGHELDQSFIIPEAGKAMLASGDNSLESIGTAKSYVWYKSNWAEAGSAPFRRFKSFPTEGGTRVVSFLSYPGHARTGIEPSYISVRDVLPTVLDLAQVKLDKPDEYHGKPVIAPQGISFAQRIFPGAPAPQLSPAFAAGEMFGRRYVREGRWKAVNIPPPTGSGHWELFDVEADPGEVHDLARQNPQQIAKMVKDWNRYAEEKGVVPPIIPGN
jgi:arylsulfatase